MTGIPMFKLRPYWSFLGSALFALVVGGLLAAYFFNEDRSGMENHTWVFVISVTLVFTLSLVIVAFSRYKFEHLKHHRAGNKRG